MSSFRIRPCFEHTVELSAAETRARILASFAQHSPSFVVKAFPDFIGLHIGDHERSFWSPRLFLVLEAKAGGTTIVQGTYGPEIEVWSVFLYGYLITSLLGTFAGVLGFAQMKIAANPWGLWVLGAMVLLAGLLYLGAQLGQKFGAGQIFQLHQAYESAVGRPTDVR